MSKVWLIAERELSAYFKTWMGYFIVFAALLIDGLLFNSFAIGSKAKFSADVLKDFFYFSSGIGMVAAVLLAMRLLAEEKQNGTITLFYSSPVTERQIVYGKYLSSLIVFLILQVISIYLPALIFLEGKVSLGHLAAGYLGVSLLGASVLSISLFSSIVTPNQLLAAVMGASLTVILLLLWLVAGKVDEPFSSIFAYISIHNRRFGPFSQGIVHVRDLVFYISLSLVFLEVSVRTLESRRMQG